MKENVCVLLGRVNESVGEVEASEIFWVRVNERWGSESAKESENEI